VAYILSRVCLSVCLYVCIYLCLSDDNFRKPSRRKFIFAHPVYLYGIILVDFVYTSHRVKAKVTEAKKVANASSCIAQLPSAIFIGTRQMAPQITPCRWLCLRLKAILFICFLCLRGLFIYDYPYNLSFPSAHFVIFRCFHRFNFLLAKHTVQVKPTDL